MTATIVTRSLRTSALVCRADVMRQVERRHHALDPYTGERIEVLDSSKIAVR